MKAHGVIKDGNIILKKTSLIEKPHDGDRVEVITLPVEKITPF